MLKTKGAWGAWGMCGACRAWRALGVVALCAVAAASAVLAAEAAGGRISSVAVTGVTGSDLVLAQRAVHVRAGDPYSQKALEDDVLALSSLPFVQGARVSQTAVPEGVAVTYEVTPKGKLPSIAFRGNKKFNRKKLMKEGQLDDMQYYDLARLTRARDLILEKYKTSGYLFARAEFASQPDGAVLFTIEEGKRLKVKTVNIIGNRAFDEAAIKKVVRTRTRRYLVLPYRLKEDVVEEDALAVQNYYRDRGYLDATVKPSLNLTSNGKGIIVDYVVSEGPLYTLRSFEITGNTIISNACLGAFLKMLPGAAFSQTRLAADVKAIKDSYGRIGYIDAAVDAATVFASDVPEVAVSYRITENTPVYVGEIEIYGNDKSRDNVIRRELEFFPGQRYNTDAMDESRKNLNRLSYFKSVDISPVPGTPGATPRDAVVTVSEIPTGQFLIGAGVSSKNGVTGRISIRQSNFDYAQPARSWRDVFDGRGWAGGGQILELSYYPGFKGSQLSLNFRNPRVNDSDYSLGLEGHLWNRERETFTERRIGGDFSVGKKITKNAFWEVGFAPDRVKVSGIERPTPQDVLDVRGTNWVNKLRFTVGHDTRDNFLNPTSGHRAAATVAGSSGAIGSDFDFASLLLEGNWYRTTRRDKLDRPHVVSLHGRTGIMSDAPIYERFYAGGSDVRGFAYRGIGPREFGESLGGQLLATGGVEYEVPLTGDLLRGAVFYDIGNVARRPGDFQVDEFRHSVGFGIRFYIPPPLNLPVLLDFGFPIKKEPGDDTQVLSFSIGGGF